MRLAAKISVILSALVLLSFGAAAQDTSVQVSKRSRLQKEIAEIEQQLKDNSSKSASALTKLSLTRQKIDARKALIAETDREIRELEDTISVRRHEADVVKARLDTMTVYFNKLVKNAYKNRDARVWYMYILASRSLGQAGRRYAYLRNLSGQMNTQAEKIKEAQASLEKQLAELDRLADMAKQTRAEQQKDLESLKAEESQSQKLITQLNRDKSKYQKQLDTKRKQVEALNKEIQRLIAEAMKDTKSSSKSNAKQKTTTQKPEDYKVTGAFESNKGKLPWPVSGSVADHYGQHYHPVYKSVKLPFNNGVNITVSKGTAAKAVFNGDVKRVIVMPGYNKCVLVQHGGYFTFYCKLSTVAVKAGDKIKAGQTIGIVDTIDGQTQLHFQIWKGTTPQDPELWLRPRD